MMPHINQRSSEVFRTLKKQVRATRSGRPLREGKLEFFREALGMRGFHDAVRRVAKVSRVDMFSTLEEVESMEKAVLGNDRVELNVQCCIILHFYERSRPFKDRLPDPRSERSWLFGSCESLEEIAYLRSRLLFVEHKTYLREIINISLVHAVEKFFRKEGSTVTWQGLLLVFREARAGCAYRLFIFLLTFLQERDANMPTAAATLFLSYVACSVYVLAANLGNYMCVIEEKIISKLLGLGASPMITREHHPVLFKRLSSQLETNRGPWWIELDNARARSLKRYPTALNRLMAHEWRQSFVDNMAKYACCSLDAVLSFKARYKVHKVASLACLAAQKVRELDLQALSPTLKFIASKHRPLFLQVFGGLR